MNKKSLEQLLRNFSLLGSRKISDIMSTISEVDFLDINDSHNLLREKIKKSKKTFYPVCDGSRENILGIIHIKDMLINALSNSKIDLSDGLHEPIYFSGESSIHQVYDIFSQSKIGAAFVIDKDNNVVGFITLKEITKTFLVNLQLEEDLGEPYLSVRPDGSWLVDGLMPIVEFKKFFKIDSIPSEGKNTFHTLGGFISSHLGKLPEVSESFEFDNYNFEAIDVDNNRIDKVLIKKIK